MRRLRQWLGAICSLALLFGGCAGGGQSYSSVMPPGGGSGSNAGVPSGATLVRVHVPWAGSGPLPAPGPFRNPSGLGGAVFPVATPPAPNPVASPSAPLGASPGPTAYPAQALTINLNGPTPVSQTIGLVPASPGCQGATGGGTVCQAALALSPGTYTATVATYSSAVASPATLTAPAQTIAFTVVPNGNNVVNLSFMALPAGIDVVPGTPMSGENAQGVIDLYGAGKHQLVVELLDANQNVIVGGGIPSFTASQVGGALTLAVTQPADSTPNTVTVAPPAAYSAGTATLRLSPGLSGSTANPCLASGAVCTGSQNIDVKQLLAVANSSANTVTFYAGGQVSPVATIQNGITEPQGLVFDTAGDIFVANQLGTISEYAAPYSGLPTSIGTGVNHPQALAVDARGDLFVANGNGSNTVTEYSPPYTGAPTIAISNGVNDPVSLGLDATGNLFVVNQAADTVTAYAPPYNAAPTVISNGLNGPNSIAIDQHGNIFVANLNSTPNSVVEYSPPFSSASAPNSWITNGVNEQGAIGLGPSSNLFVPNQGANTVTEYAPPYGGSPTVITGGQNQPVAIAIDAVGLLFVANYGNNTVTEYPPPYGGASWTTIAAGVSNPQALALSPSTAAGNAILP